MTVVLEYRKWYGTALAQSTVSKRSVAMHIAPALDLQAEQTFVDGLGLMLWWETTRSRNF